MYIAPLNYDRFFKKIFSDLRIAKRFLEDFFDTTIEEIELLPSRHRLTDEAMVVEFDFRCKINGQYVIIDMQQWFKTDVVKRFYVYHCLNTALQLEALPFKNLPMGKDKVRKTKDFLLLEPVVTLLWMADATFGSEENLLVFAQTPDLLPKLLLDDALWAEGNEQELRKARERALKAMSANRVSQLNFLGENKLIYAFQGNIVKAEKIERYVRWFRFAEKSKNLDNVKEDFDEFLNDEIFMEIMHRLDKNSLGSDDIQYIKEYASYDIAIQQFREGLFVEGEQIGMAKGEQIGMAKGEQIGMAKGDFERRVKGAENCLLSGLTIAQAAQINELTTEEVEKIAIRLGLSAGKAATDTKKKPLMTKVAKKKAPKGK